VVKLVQTASDEGEETTLAYWSLLQMLVVLHTVSDDGVPCAYAYSSDAHTEKGSHTRSEDAVGGMLV
jgi:hypothetical protein